MLPKENRLSKQKDFDNVLKHGRASYNKFIGIKATKNDLKLNRFGIIISAKVSKKAVLRNKIRRQIKAILKQENTCLVQGTDFVFITMPPITKEDKTTIHLAIKNAFKKLNLYNKNQ